MKILIITNHSYMLWRFRRELIQELQKKHEVVLSMPFVGHQDDFQGLGVRCIDTDVDRRGINPKTDIKLVRAYDRLLKKEKPDLVITYSIKPNVYAGFLCRMRKIPYFANVQGLGTAFQKPGLAQFVTMLYKAALRDAKGVFFENDGNAKEFRKRHITKKEKQIVLHGAGINLDYYPYAPYPENDKLHFLYLGRIMREKGMDELFGAVKRLHAEGESFVLDLVGFFEDEYKAHIEDKKCVTNECKALAKMEINVEKCKRCGLCAKNCPVGAITGDRENGYIIDSEKCIKCGLCSSKCHFGAI